MYTVLRDVKSDLSNKLHKRWPLFLKGLEKAKASLKDLAVEK